MNVLEASLLVVAAVVTAYYAALFGVYASDWVLGFIARRLEKQIDEEDDDERHGG